MLCKFTMFGAEINTVGNNITALRFSDADSAFVFQTVFCEVYYVRIDLIDHNNKIYAAFHACINYFLVPEYNGIALFPVYGQITAFVRNKRPYSVKDLYFNSAFIGDILKIEIQASVIFGRKRLFYYSVHKIHI